MRKYALIQDNIVVKVEDLEDSEITEKMKVYTLVIDIEDLDVIPEEGWIFQGNQLVPSVPLSPLEQLEKSITKAVEFGMELKKEMSVKIGMRNIILERTESQIASLVSQIISIGFLLDGGALHTAKTAIGGVKVAFPEYADECDYAINRINDFLG